MVYRLLKLVLVLPVATAIVERCFSAMKIVKTCISIACRVSCVRPSTQSPVVFVCPWPVQLACCLVRRPVSLRTQCCVCASSAGIREFAVSVPSSFLGSESVSSSAVSCCHALVLNSLFNE